MSDWLSKHLDLGLMKDWWRLKIDSYNYSFNCLHLKHNLIQSDTFDGYNWLIQLRDNNNDDN